MHVALNGYFWDQQRTGSGQYIHHLATALAALRRASGEPERYMYSLLLPPSARRDGTLVVPPGITPRRMKTRLYAANPGSSKVKWEYWDVSRAASKIGASVLHAPYLTAPFLGGAASVVTAHDMIPWVLDGYRGSYAVRLYLALAARAVKRATLILADSDASRRDVMTVLGVDSNRVRTVYLGVKSPPVFSAQELEEVRERYGLPDRFAFYLGGFDRRKNVPLLLGAWRQFVEAVNHVPAPVLAIGGQLPDPGDLFPDVAAAALSQGFAANDRNGPVRFLGRISEEDKPKLMKAASLFVYASAYEGFGLDPLEALSMGCPVVSSSGGSLKEVVGDAGILVLPDDVGALASAIGSIWTDERLADELRVRGPSQAMRFTWEKTAQLTLLAYEDAQRFGRKGRANS